MAKEKLYLDFDGTVFNTIDAICNLYNQDFEGYHNFTPVDWQSVHTWDFEELSLANRDIIDFYFNTPRFFEVLKYMPYAKKALQKLQSKYDFTFVTIGDMPNLNLKMQYLNYIIPDAKVALIASNVTDKSSIDMSDGIFIDDRADNLISSNAKLKICYGNEYPWNKDWLGIKEGSWLSVMYYLEAYLNE